MLRSLIIPLVFLLSFQCCEMSAENTASSVDHKNMVKIPDGKFTPFYKKKDQNEVFVKSFYMDVYAVTNAEYLIFIKANPKWSKSNISKLYTDGSYLKHWKSDFAFGKDSLKIYNSPVTNISWFAAKAYCKWKGKRMPTTNEWEYAASADIANRVAANKTTILEIILDWYDKPTPTVLPNVGTTFKNKFGLYDMHGLIWEWVYDFNSYVTGGDSRSSSEVERDLFCGSAASNSTNKSDYAAYMRYGYRGSLKGSYTVANLGFRCAMDIKN